MKTYLLTLLFLLVLWCITAVSQNPVSTSPIDSFAQFNEKHWTDIYWSNHSSSSGLKEYLTAQKRDYIRQTFYPTAQRLPNQNPQPQQACTNIDFENGTLNGWQTSTGYNPGYNPSGCCANIGGSQNITTGAGNDACGGFPIVAPGGNFSLRLGNNGTGGVADRIEQTFAVTSTNANFTYKYAVVLEDPGHAVTDQPSFQIDMIDTLGNPIPCTYYNVSAGQNIPGFINSPNCANVVYKPWTNVSVDLTNYIGQNITIRFTTYDCALGGHYGYAYLDGSCLDFNINQNAILCQGSSVQLSAPSGFATYNWTLPNGTSASGQTISTNTPGYYTLNLTTVTGCPGPTLTYLLVEYPKPNSNFIPVQVNACSQNVNFINNSNISNGNIISNNWIMGDGNTSSSLNSSNTYSNTGTYNVQLIVTSNMGCTDTTTTPITIYPNPVASFSANSVCLNNQTTFINTSTSSNSNITNTLWNFGDGSQSSQNQTTHNYTLAGTYNVMLTVTNNVNCIHSITLPVTVYALPNVTFTGNNVCQGNSTIYTNNSTVTSGSITNYLWDFNNDGNIDNTSQTPTYIFASSGTYTTLLTAISNNNCVSTNSIMVSVFANPIVNFSSNAVCEGVQTNFTNQTTVQNGQIINNLWTFGDNTNSNNANPTHLYSNFGNYNVTLTSTSNNNCTNSITIPAIVYAKPTVNFQSTTTCLNQATQFNNQSSIGIGTIIKYRWDFENDGIVDDSTTNPSFVYSAAGNFQSKLQAISNNNCSNQNIGPVVVHYNPVANFTSPSACLPNPSSFTNLSTSIDGIITSYAWDFNGDNMTDNTSQNPFHIFTQNGNYGVKLEVQTQYGCVNTIIKSAYVNPSPSANFTTQNNVGCPSLCVNFINSSTISNGSIVTNQWIFGDASNPEYTQNATHCYQTGAYTVILKVVSDSGCINSFSSPNIITVYPTPTAGFNVTPEEIEITTPMIEVTDASMGTSSIQYKFDDGTVQNTANFNYTFNTNVAKTVSIMQIAVNSYGCRDSIIKKVEIKPAYVIYVPNAFTPNSDGINDGFKAVGIGVAEFKLQIFDRWGELIFETSDINKAWDGSVRGKDGGENSKQEVYVWKAQVTDVLREKHSLIGHVTVLK